MKIIIAPDSFKGSLNAIEVAKAIELGFAHALPSASIISVPMADGGEGTLDSLNASVELNLYPAEVTNPLGKKISSQFGILKDNTAVIEMAKASGLSLIPKAQQNPLKTTSFGTGELILAALNKGCRRFILALGGSATCEGGIGALAALGIQFKNSAGEEIAHTAEGLEKLIQIDSTHLDPRILESEFIIAHDVDNPLLGLEGALMYAPQKGATPEQVEILHKILENYSLIVSEKTKKNIGELVGGGAAGGMAAGLYAFLNAHLKPGAIMMCEQIHLKEKMQDADLIVTGEGRIDSQTIHGKTPITVAKLAKESQIPVIAIAAVLGKGYYEVYAEGIDAVFSIVNGPISEEICLQFTEPLLMAAANNIARLLALRGIK